MPIRLGKFYKIIFVLLFFLHALAFIHNGEAEEIENELLFESKCSTCHTLGRVRRRKKSKNRWRRRVKRCAQKTQYWEDASKWINKNDVKNIVNYLSSTQSFSRKKTKSPNQGSRYRVEKRIKKAKDTENMTAIEKIHVPIFIVPEILFSREKFNLIIKVGQRNHPMVKEHRIHWLELYQDGELLKKFEFKSGDEPQARMQLLMGNVTELRAVVYCNKHRLWEGRKQIRAR